MQPHTKAIDSAVGHWSPPEVAFAGSLPFVRNRNAMLFSYEFLLYSSLYLTYAFAFLQFLHSFVPRFSPLTLLNALLLATVFAPLATDQLDLGTRVGLWLWLGNCLFSVLLVVRWALHDFAGKEGLPVVGSLLGLVAFGWHVFVFAACP